MPKKRRKLVVVGKLREFDEAGWKRLLMAYAYYLHDQETQEVNPPRDRADRDEDGGHSCC